MRSRWPAATATIAATAALGSCGSEAVGPGAGPTLPPIVTTSTTSTTVPTPTTLPQYYEVQRGDTLTEIAAAYSIPVRAIMELNGMTDPDDLRAGQILELPPRDIVARELPPTVPGQTAPTMPGEGTTTVPGATGEGTSVPGTTTA